MKVKTFTFKYDPNFSLKRMGEEIKEAVRTGKPSVHPDRIRYADIEDIMKEMSSTRLKLFSCLVTKKPQSLYQLAQLLSRDYANVWGEAKSLAQMGIIKLEKENGRIRPIPLYERVVFDFSV